VAATTPNVYTRRWFSTFLGRIDADIVAREVAFLRRQLPAAAHVLDLCCGPGRHAGPLTDAGYRATGLDRDEAALRDAAHSAPRGAFVRGDMRRVPLASKSVDAVICMWQSFGHFDTDGNRAVLAEMARVLVPNGRLVLDLYNLGFHAVHVGERVIERDGERVYESRAMTGDRLRVKLQYESTGMEELFDWALYTPASLVSVGDSVGLQARVICSEFDERIEPSSERARMQIVLEKR
jgi:SAM-dependent methyltransferase